MAGFIGYELIIDLVKIGELPILLDSLFLGIMFTR